MEFGNDNGDQRKDLNKTDKRIVQIFKTNNSNKGQKYTENKPILDFRVCIDIQKTIKWEQIVNKTIFVQPTPQKNGTKVSGLKDFLASKSH